MGTIFKRILVSLVILSILVVPNTTVRAASDIIVTVLPHQTIQQNSKPTIKVNVKNTASVDISNITLTIKGEDYSLLSGASTMMFESGIISPNAEVTKDVVLKYYGNSTKIPVTWSYEKSGTVVTLDDYLVVDALVSSSTPPTQPTTSQYEPTLIIGNTTMPTVVAGLQSTVTFELKNTSNFQASHVTIAPDGKSINQKIDVKAQYFTPIDTDIVSKGSKAFTLDIFVDGTLEPGTYAIDLITDFTNAWGDKYHKTYTAYVEVKANTNNQNTVRIKETSVSSTQPKPDTDISFTFTLTNGDSKTISNLEAWIEGLPTDSFSLIDTTASQKINSMSASTSKSLTYKYHIKPTAVSGSYAYKLVYQYTDGNGNLVKKESAYNLYVASTTPANAVTGLEISALKYPASVKQDEGFNVSFKVMNTGEVELKNVKIQLNDNTVMLPKTSSIITISKMAAGASQEVSFELVGTGENLVSRNYPISFTITYDVVKGGTVVNEKVDQSVGVYLDAKDASDPESSTSVPKVIVDKYESDPMIINAGSEFTLNLSFMNTHSVKSIYNVKIFLTATDGTAQSGSVFSPVDSSNTFYIDEITPKESVERSIRMYTIPDASPKTYEIKVNFEYEDADGKPYTSTEIVGMHVKQETKLEMADTMIPEQMFMGDMVPLYFEIFNTGKAKAFNVMIKADGDFMLDPATKFIGNMEPGVMDYYEGTLFATMIGESNGRIVLSYDDATGEHFEVVKEIHMIVDEMIMPDPGMGGGDGGWVDPGMPPVEEAKKMNPWLIGGIAGGAAVLVLIVVIIILKKRKAKREGLMFDEE